MRRVLATVMTVGGAVVLILGVLGMLDVAYFGINPGVFALVGGITLISGVVLNHYQKKNDTISQE